MGQRPRLSTFALSYTAMRPSSLLATFSQHAVQPRVVLSSTVSRLHTRVADRSLSIASQTMQTNSSSTSRARLDRPRLQITENQDDAAIRSKYRPFLLHERVAESDWISKLELDTVEDMVQADLDANNGQRLQVLVLYGSLRSRSYSRLLAFECARILQRLGCDVRVFDPTDLPVKDDTRQDHPKVQELRQLSTWSNGHVWVSPEQHGNLTAVFKNQIDWIPLSTGSVRPTQGRTLAIAQVSGGSQSFNTVNSLRLLGRWMRLFVIPNQSSIPQAYTQFTDAHDPKGNELDALLGAEGGSRLMPSSNRDRVVDCMEEFVKYTILMRPHFNLFADRYSERNERRLKEEKAAAERLAKATLEGEEARNGLVNGVNLKGM